MKKKTFFIIMATLVMNSISTSVYGVTGDISVNAVEKSQHRSVQEIDINSGNDITSEECNINDKKDNSIPNEFTEYTKFIGRDVSILNVDTSQWNYRDFSHDLWEGSLYGHKGMIYVRLGWDDKTITDFIIQLNTNDGEYIQGEEYTNISNKLEEVFGASYYICDGTTEFYGNNDYQFRLCRGSGSIGWNEENREKFDNTEPKNPDEINVVTETPKVAPAIGMTSEEVENSTWGKPYDINKTTNEYGTSEQWVYKFLNKHRYIYFKDGIVTTIQE